MRVAWEQMGSVKAILCPLTWDPPSLRDMMRPDRVCRQSAPPGEIQPREFLFVSLRPLCSHIIIFGQNL